MSKNREASEYLEKWADEIYKMSSILHSLSLTFNGSGATEEEHIKPLPPY